MLGARTTLNYLSKWGMRIGGGRFGFSWRTPDQDRPRQLEDW
jgi:hypothetical protein